MNERKQMLKHIEGPKIYMDFIEHLKQDAELQLDQEKKNNIEKST